jgi:hypothetical protein
LKDNIWQHVSEEVNWILSVCDGSISTIID